MTQDRERLHTAVLVAPSKERRKLRKQRRRAEARLHAEQRTAALAAAKVKAEQERAERRATIYLPGRPASQVPLGCGRPAGSISRGIRTRRRHWRVRIRSSPRAVSVPMGCSWGRTCTRVGVSSTTRGCCTRVGSSPPRTCAGRDRRFGEVEPAKSLYTRSLPFGRRVYVPGDPKGEHTAVANAVGGRAIILGHGLNTRLNPPDEGHRLAGLSDEQWTSTVAARRRDLIGALAETVLARGLSPLEHTAIDIALTQTVRENDVPILPMVVERILPPARMPTEGWQRMGVWLVTRCAVS